MNDIKTILLDELTTVTRAELCSHGRISAADLDLLTALGLIPQGVADDRYPASCLRAVRRALRLKHGLDTDWELVAVIMDLLQEIDGLRRELAGLRARSLYARDDEPA